MGCAMPVPCVSRGHLEGREDGGLSAQVPLPGQDVSPASGAAGAGTQGTVEPQNLPLPL